MDDLHFVRSDTFANEMMPDVDVFAPSVVCFIFREADGGAVLQRTCQQCHELAVASKKLESEDWGTVITRMMTYGARLTPVDRQKLIEYLSGR